MIYMRYGDNRDAERDRNIPPNYFIPINILSPQVTSKSTPRTNIIFSKIIYVKFN